jgi:thiaminase/transcriptional activator TenA
MFAEHAAGAITVEKSLHDGFLKDFGLPEGAVDRVPAARTTLAYTSYLLRIASLGDYPEVLAAVLPCYWIYERVGKTLLENGSPEPRYQKWIDTYGGEDFGVLVQAVLDLTDKACEGLDPGSKAAPTKPSSPPPATSGCSGTPPGAARTGRFRPVAPLPYVSRISSRLTTYYSRLK